MAQGRYWTAHEVAAALGVSVPTVYAYVSRGLLRSEPAQEKKRTRRYLAEDAQRLLAQKVARRDPAQVANDTMHWGMPVLESALTLITEHGLYYRGKDAVRLAERATIEQVAALLWTGEMDQAETLFANNQPAPDILRQCRDIPPALAPLPRMQIALAYAAAADLAAYDLDLASGNAPLVGARIVKALAATLAGADDADSDIVTILRQGWRRTHPAAARLLNAGLILCADHELNASAFTARVTASAAAHLYLVVTAGLATLQGFKHGGFTALVEALLREIGEPERARAVIAARLQRGEFIPGFGHRLYPAGDPRGAALLRMVSEAFPDSPAVALAQAVVAAVEDATGKRPTIDLGLVALAQALGLPTGSALALFAVGRAVGWIGHAIEQYRVGELIRPRATYVGPLPDA